MNNLIQFFISNKQFLNFSYFLTKKKIDVGNEKEFTKWKEQKQIKFYEKLSGKLIFLQVTQNLKIIYFT